MAIFRIKKEDNYVAFDKRFLQDKKLSAKAKGVLAYLLSLPPDWEVHIDEIVTHFSDGKRSIYAAFQELKQTHYIVHQRQRDARGIFRAGQYLVFNTPQIIEQYESHSQNESFELFGISVAKSAISKETMVDSSSIKESIPFEQRKLWENQNSYSDKREENLNQIPHCQNSNVDTSCAKSNPHCSFPHVDNADVENPHVEKSTVLINKYNNNINKNNTATAKIVDNLTVISQKNSEIAAACFKKNDFVIGKELTPHQVSMLEEFVRKNHHQFLNHLGTLAFVQQALQAEILNPNSFSKIGNNFHRKFNAIRNLIQKGEWIPALCVQKKQEDVAEQSNQEKKLQAEIFDLERDINGCLHDINRFEGHSSVVECRKKDLKICEEKLAVLVAELKVIKGSHEPAEATNSYFGKRGECHEYRTATTH